MAGKIQLFCFLASYVVAWGFELFRLRGSFRLGRILTLFFATAGISAHTLFLIHRSQLADAPPLLGSTRDWLLVLSWLIVLSYLFLSVCDKELAIGLFTLPVVLLITASAYLVNSTRNELLDALHGWKMLHAATLALGMLGVTVSIILALMYFYQAGRLRNRKEVSEGMGLPSLEKLTRLNRWAVIISVPMLTIGMATGVGLAIFSKQNSESPIRLADPVIVSYCTVLLGMLALFLWLIGTPRASGRQLAYLTIWAAGFLLCTVIALQVLSGQKLSLLETWH